MFIDPDTGLWAGKRRREDDWAKHIGSTEFSEIADAQERKHKLTLVYDQSYSRGAKNMMERVERKLEMLKKLSDGHRLHGAAYVSHVAFIWMSRDETVMTQATQRLLTSSRLPHCRFVGI